MVPIVDQQKPFVYVSNLTKNYKNTTAVDSIDISIRKGEVYGLIGPNGAGKTTALECLEGIRKPDSGTIRIAGLDPLRQEKEIRKIMGIQLQVASMPENILPKEAMQLICMHNHLPVRYDLLDRFGLDELSKKEYRQLSTGQKRRLHLSLALANSPSILILDEPTAGLDVPGRAELHQSIRELKAKGITVILATHDMAEAESMCDRVSILVKGRIVATGTPAEITTAAKNEALIQIRTEKNSILAIPRIGHAHFMKKTDDYGVWLSSNIADDLILLLEIIRKNQDKVVDLRVQKPSLEEAFLDMLEGGTKS